jgi:tetratricopeptide (TPR) repeat protein
MEFSFNATKEANEKARQMFEKAIELDPKYSDPYAWLGYALLVDQLSQWRRDPHGFDRTIQLEQQSIALDNYNASAYALLSVALNNDRQYDRSVTAAERALALAPNHAGGYSALAFVLTDSGKPAEALVALHKAMRLDPREPDLYALMEGRTYLLMGRYEEAIPVLKRFLARYSNLIPAHLFLIACYVELGRNEEARAEAAEVMRINPQFSLAVQKQMASMRQPFRDRIYGDIAKAGLK